MKVNVFSVNLVFKEELNLLLEILHSAPIGLLVKVWWA